MLLLKIHTRQHLSDESAKFKLPCLHPGCNFRAADPSVISKHKKLHQKTNEGKYRCVAEDCEYYAIQATGLKNHVFSKHPSLYAATMKCSYKNCEFVSVNPERLKRHVLAHEKGLLDAKEEVEVKEDNKKTNLNASMEVCSESDIIDEIRKKNYLYRFLQIVFCQLRVQILLSIIH